MRSPRIWRICSDVSVSRSWPAYVIEPAAMRPGGDATRRMIDSAVTDLPEPDSPTTPSVPRSGISNDTPSTARTVPCSVRNSVTRSRISSNAIRGDYGTKRLSRSDDINTDTLDNDIAAAAYIGDASPAASIGMQTRLQSNAPTRLRR